MGRKLSESFNGQDGLFTLKFFSSQAWTHRKLILLLQVHADASNFAHGITKEDAYEQVLWQAEGLITDQRNWVRQTISVAGTIGLTL